MRYVLASGSPRRKELLGKIIPEFEIIPAASEEKTSKVLPYEVVEELSPDAEVMYLNYIYRDFNQQEGLMDIVNIYKIPKLINKIQNMVIN